MRKSTVWFLAGVMVFAFVGLLYLQINYIRIILNSQEEQFADAVKRSLYQVSYDLELDETKQLLTDRILKKYRQDKIDQSTILLRSTTPSFGKNDFHTATKAIQDAIQDGYIYQENVLEDVIRSAMKGSRLPLEERIDFRKLDSYIQQELANNNLALPYVFAVMDASNNIVYASSEYRSDIQDVFSQILFSKDPSNRIYTLQVAFPTMRKYYLHSTKFVTPSIVFTLVLMIAFIYTLYLVLRQKYVSELKNDFINNMTHELKTPVASISLAAQTMNDTEIVNSPHLMEHAKKVILDESSRLGFLVEKVLQMSLFDDKAVQFKMTKLDANDLITDVARIFALRVENAGGMMALDLDALNSTIVVDKMHFTNVIFNLMENAVKYRRLDEPLMLIARTWNIGTNILIIIEDNGIGIKKESLRRVFERFYRVPTGNRHDVKGCGLGLAYVKHIITHFDGTIKAESEYGEGTKFIITLPFVNN